MVTSFPLWAWPNPGAPAHTCHSEVSLRRETADFSAGCLESWLCLGTIWGQGTLKFRWMIKVCSYQMVNPASPTSLQSLRSQQKPQLTPASAHSLQGTETVPVPSGGAWAACAH